MVRALESRRRDRLFHDPYAASFLDAAHGVVGSGAVAWIATLSACGGAFWSHIVIRTRFFDDYLLDAAHRGIRQIVILAAGLDTRAYRLEWPVGVQVHELDLAEVSEFKRRVLDQRRARPRCEHRAVAADLRGDWVTPLAAGGWYASKPTAWLMEGLLNYLSAGEAERLLATVTDVSAVDSRVAFEVDEFDAREQASAIPSLADYAMMWKGGLPGAPEWLAARGWRLDANDPTEIAGCYGRAAAKGSGGFLTATRV
jgi:methyltransferase (TIGR00027 family)